MFWFGMVCMLIALVLYIRWAYLKYENMLDESEDADELMLEEK